MHKQILTELLIFPAAIYLSSTAIIFVCFWIAVWWRNPFSKYNIKNISSIYQCVTLWTSCSSLSIRFFIPVKRDLHNERIDLRLESIHMLCRKKCINGNIFSCDIWFQIKWSMCSHYKNVNNWCVSRQSKQKCGTFFLTFPFGVYIIHTNYVCVLISFELIVSLRFNQSPISHSNQMHELLIRQHKSSTADTPEDVKRSW